MAECRYGKTAYNEVELARNSFYGDPGAPIEAYCTACSRCFYLDRRGLIRTIGVCPENTDNGLRQAELVVNDTPSILGRFRT